MTRQNRFAVLKARRRGSCWPAPPPMAPAGC